LAEVESERKLRGRQVGDDRRMVVVVVVVTIEASDRWS